MSTEEQKRKKRDTEWVMSTEQGRRFIWELLSLCGIYRSMEGDTESILVQEGARRIGLHLLGITTDASDDLVFKMMLEAKNKTIEEKVNEPTKHRSDAEQFEHDYTDGNAASGSDELPEYATGFELSGQFL